MNFTQNISLSQYATDANTQYNAVQSRLSKIESGFQVRMDGRSIGGLIGSFIFTLCWLAAFVVGAVYTAQWVYKPMLLACLGSAFLLILFMMIDTVVNVSYYGKIAGYKSTIVQLRNRVNTGRDSVKTNHDAFMASRAKGWHYPLYAGSSIPRTATAIETTMAGMESLKAGFLNGVKNVFYYITVIIFTITSCYSLFPISNRIIVGISGENLAPKTLLILNLVALAIIFVLEIIFAKGAWGASNCSVKNTTLFILLAGPAMFLALVALATLIVMLVIGLISVVLAILGFIIAAVFAFFCCCGG